MGQGYTRNDTANNISDGNVIDAVDLDGEFDAIVAAFHASTGHTHDGTSAEGAPINVMGPAQEFLVDGTAIYPKTDNTYDLGKAAALIRALYATTAIVSVAQVTTLKANDGTAAGSIADSTGVVTLASAVLTTADINGGTMDSVTIGATTPAAVTTSSLVATTADINGGTIDATTIGATTPAAGSFTDVNATGTVDGRDVATDGTKLDTVETNADVTDTTNVTAAGALMDSELASVAAVKATTGTFLTADQSKLDGIEALADVTDVTNVTAAGALMDSELASIASVKALDQGVATTDSPTFAGATLTTADINGGTIDGVTIGGTVAAAGTFTTLTSTGIDDNATSTAITIDASENVLVGNDDFSAITSTNGTGIALQASGTVWASRNDVGLVLNRLTSDGEIAEFKKDGTTVGSIGTSGGKLTVSSSSGVAMRIDSSGTVAIGSTTTQGYEKLYVVHSNVPAVFHRTGTSGGVINILNNNGVVGSISTSGSTTSYNTSSDYRLKGNVTPVQGAADIVKAMRPCTYTFNSDGSWHDGFLAHELQEFHPRAVVGEKDAMKDEEYEITPAVIDEDGVVVTEAVMGTRSVPDYQQVDYSKLTPILTAALKEALEKIDALEERITAMEK